MRWVVAVGVMAVALMGATAPAHATTQTFSAASSLDVESEQVRLIVQMAPVSSDLERDSLALELAPPTASQDASRQASMRAATPPPSELLLVGTGRTAPPGRALR